MKVGKKEERLTLSENERARLKVLGMSERRRRKTLKRFRQ
jgi:hypothetical protein